MNECVEDVKSVARILEGGLEKTVVREDFGQVVVCLESRTLDSRMEGELSELKSVVEHRQANGTKTCLRVEPSSRRVFYLAPDKTIDGHHVDYKELRDELKHAGFKV